MRRKNFNAIMCRAVEFKMSVHSTEQCYTFFLLYLSLSCPILSCVRFFFLSEIPLRKCYGQQRERTPKRLAT